MKLTVTGRNIKITDAIQEHLEKKIERHIRPWVDGPGDIHLALSVEKDRHLAEATVKSKGFTVHSENETNDLYAAIDTAVDKIEKQLKKHRDRAISLKTKRNAQISNKTTE
ncbi:MAG: ribosome hibernation-promoting factor, HPF/YfiA family [Nitrospinaceae bacterium]